MEDLIERARTYAIGAHARINQLRKYTRQPYDVHLKAVAELVASVSDDEAMVAAAWLHDTVEDTPATFEDIEREFGADVMQLVKELTDVSRPGDGNRAVRKAIDRQHTAGASPRAKTIKLADIIDNCEDICRHDAKFGRVYLGEAAALLEVLAEGDEKLYAQAAGLIAACKVEARSCPRRGVPPGGAGARARERQARAGRAARHPALHGSVCGPGHPGAAAVLRCRNGRAAAPGRVAVGGPVDRRGAGRRGDDRIPAPRRPGRRGAAAATGNRPAAARRAGCAADGRDPRPDPFQPLLCRAGRRRRRRHRQGRHREAGGADVAVRDHHPDRSAGRRTDPRPLAGRQLGGAASARAAWKRRASSRASGSGAGFPPTCSTACSSPTNCR